MITKLSKDQEEKLSVYRDKWLKIGLSTEKFDFKTAKEISDYYYINFLGKEPVPVVIMDSPLSAWLAVCMLSNNNNQVGNQVESQVRDQVENQVWNQVRSQVWSQVWNQVWNQVRDQVRSQVRSQVQSQVWSQVRSQVESQVENYIHPYIDGHLFTSYFSFYDFMNEVLDIKYDCQEKYDWYKSTTKIGNFYPLENVCIISQKPIEINMKNGRLHADGKPSITYADEFSVWSLNGVRVPKYLAETPAGCLDIEFFKKEKNIDIKAEFIRKYGIDRMIDLGNVIDTFENHKKSHNYKWYSDSEYKVIDMKCLFPDRYNYLPYLYMKNQTTGVYHLECVYNPDLKQQPRTIVEALTVRMGGISPEETEILFIK